MLLKTVFLLLILWFILVAVGNFMRAIRADSRNARRARPSEPYPPRRRTPPPGPASGRNTAWYTPAERVRVRTYGPYRNGEPIRKPPSPEEDVDDAKFRDLP